MHKSLDDSLPNTEHSNRTDRHTDRDTFVAYMLTAADTRD